MSLTLGLWNNFDHPTDIIAAIIDLLKLVMVSKPAIEEIITKVSFQTVSFKI
jgi:hypothetical protein